MTPAALDPAELPIADLDGPDESWRVVLIPLGITPRRPRLLCEHPTEAEALGAAVRAAAAILGWSVDVLPPAPHEV